MSQEKPKKPRAGVDYPGRSPKGTTATVWKDEQGRVRIERHPPEPK